MELRKAMDAALGEAMDEAWADMGNDYAAACLAADPAKKFVFRMGGRWIIKPQGGEYVVKCRVTTGRRTNHDSGERVAKRGAQ